MKLNYVITRSTVRPEAVDETSSKTTVYLHKNIQEKKKEPTEFNNYTSSTYFEYEEATLTKKEYAKYLEYIDIDSAHTRKIAESKAALALWLAANPMLYTDGRLYSVTEEKQTLLNSNLASYERAKTAGIEYPLKWNSTGDECVSWKYSDLVSLSLAIAAYVAPKVSKQQEIEIEIKACETAEELEGIVISYD